MPRPAYVMLSESGTIDEQSMKASYFNVVEVCQVTPRRPGKPATLDRKREFRLVAAWLRTDADSATDQYDAQVALVTPDGTELFLTVPEPFSFPPEIFSHRIICSNVTLAAFPTLGVYTCEGRLRRTGETEWAHRQSFAFLVKVAEPVEAGGPGEVADKAEG